MKLNKLKFGKWDLSGICGGVGQSVRYISLLCIMAFLFSLVVIPPAYATGVAEKKQELRNVQKNIKAKNSQLKSLKKQQRSVIGELSAIETNMQKTQNQISSLSNQLQVTQNNIVITQRNLNEAKTELARQSDIMHERMINV